MNKEEKEIVNENNSNLNNKDNAMININEKGQINKVKDLAFNRLRSLQSLLKKESALKELFIKTTSETIKTIEENCRQIYKKKLDVFLHLNRLNNDNKENYIKRFVLIEKMNDHLKDLSNYIPKLLIYLWEDPIVVKNLLLHMNINDIKKNIAPFLVNNFYENILSFNYLQENFMFVLSLLLKEEISSLKSPDNLLIFLQDTPCGCLLDQLINKIDIKSYFNKILKDIIESIENKCSERKMYFLIEKIEEQMIDKTNKSKNASNTKGKNRNKQNEHKIDVYRKNPTESLDSSNISDLLSFSSNFGEENDTDEDFNREKLDKESSKLFSEKYTPDLCAAELKANLDLTDDIRMKNYYQFQLKFCEEKDDYFSNKTFMKKIFESKFSADLLNEYQLNFMKVILIIKEIFNKLLNELHLLPYSIKCLCKIILLLIRKKFPNITTTEENAFIAKFFFCKLFGPIFRDPSTGALINNFIISGNTSHNLDVISQIIFQFVSGRLYREGGKHGEYTPFNWFFMEEMPFLLNFFDNLTKVKLPKFIDDFINDKLEEKYVYDYFHENPDKIIFHRSICFNIYDIKCLLENMNNCKDIIFENDKDSGLFKTFNKLYNNKKNITFLNDLINKQDNSLKNTGGSNNSSLNLNINSSNNSNDNGKKNSVSTSENNVFSLFFGFGKKKKETVVNEDKNKGVMNYYLIADLLINNKYKYIFDLKPNNNFYRIKELEECKNEEDVNKNILIKVKNFLSSLLCNYRQLEKTDFDEGTTNNTIDILKELKTYMKSSDFVIDGSIPSEWYVVSLLEYLQKLPNNLTENEYELLFKDMENDLNNSLKELDFETLSSCLNKVKFVHKGIAFYENAKQILIDILLNNKVKKIVETVPINVQLKFKYGDKEKKFKIKSLGVNKKQLQLLDNMYGSQNDKYKKICYTVKDFCKNFPDLVEYQEKQLIDVFKMQSELEIPKKLQYYFDYVRECLLKSKKISDRNSFEIINEKIYDYVMSKIYNKIFPNESDKKDDKIFQNSIKLSWIEPKHFIPGKKNYVYDSFLPDVIKSFDLLYKEKSPRKKIISMSNIFTSISNLVKFNNEGVENLGVDDQMPILNYSLIKASPKRIYSICRFLKLYIGDLKNKSEGNQLTQLSGICERVIEINNDSLINVTEEEFKRKCSNSLYGIGKGEETKYF